MSRRGDAVSALAWAVLGAGVLVASWRMDRLTHLGIEPWAAPGLLPGVVGALMIGFAAALGWSAWRARPDDAPAVALAAEPTPAAEADGGSAGLRGAVLAAALCIAFAGLGLGRGLPFATEAAAFVLIFIAAFSWRRWRAERRVGRGLAVAAVVALVSAHAIAALFESVFLVRLP